MKVEEMSSEEIILAVLNLFSGSQYLNSASVYLRELKARLRRLEGDKFNGQDTTA